MSGVSGEYSRISYVHLHTDMLKWKVTVKGYNITESIISQDYNLISPITDIVCINFIHERRHPQFGVDSESQFFFFEKLLGASI